MSRLSERATKSNLRYDDAEGEVVQPVLVDPYAVRERPHLTPTREQQVIFVAEQSIFWKMLEAIVDGFKQDQPFSARGSLGVVDWKHLQGNARAYARPNGLPLFCVWQGDKKPVALTFGLAFAMSRGRRMPRFQSDFERAFWHRYLNHVVGFNRVRLMPFARPKDQYRKQLRQSKICTDLLLGIRFQCSWMMEQKKRWVQFAPSWARAVCKLGGVSDKRIERALTLLVDSGLLAAEGNTYNKRYKLVPGELTARELKTWIHDIPGTHAKKQEAFRLRTRGKSLREIARTLQVGKTTVADWISQARFDTTIDTTVVLDDVG